MCPIAIAWVLLVMNMFAFAETVDRTIVQRWPVEQRLGAVEAYMYPDHQLMLLEWMREGSDESRSRAVDWLRKRLENAGANVNDVVTSEGSRPGQSRQDLLRIRDEALERALLWYLTGEDSHAHRAREILLAFAQTLPHWPLYNNSGTKSYSQQDRRYLRSWDANGLWGRWYPLDLGQSIPLLRAYDLLRAKLSEEDRQLIENNLFIHQKQLIEKFRGVLYLYHNTAGYHLMPLIRFGMVLDKPEYVHEAVRYLAEQLRYSYATDGIFREVTPDYHIQISTRLERGIPEMLHGYSDPAGFVDPVTGLRFDHLDLADIYRPFYERMKRGLSVLVMPDGSYLNINDSWPKRISAPSGDALGEPGLLGVTGLAKLASGGMTAFLKFGGIRGHDHLDGLNLVWFAGGKEVISDTGYRSLDGGFEREWSTGTASHATVAVDEEFHFRERVSTTVPDHDTTFTSRPPQVVDSYSLEAALPAAARYNNQGRLLIWNVGDSRVQAMEAEQPAVYPGKTGLFRRTLVMVPLDEQGNGYLVDIFRVRGGRMHDYFLKGGLDHPFKMQVDLPLQPKQGKLYRHIDLNGEVQVEDRVTVVAEYQDGQQVRSQLVAHPGHGESILQLLKGEAPAIRRSGNAPFAILRHHQGEDNDAELESCYVWIHETGKLQTAIQEVVVQRQQTELILAIRHGDVTDVVFSGINTDSRYDYAGWTFQGTLAFARQSEEGGYGRVFQGGELYYGQQRFQGVNLLQGHVVETTMRERGDAKDSVLLEIENEYEVSQDYRLLHLDFNETVRFSIPIKSITQEGDRLRVELQHSPGFTVEPDASVMTSFPSWRVRGVCRAVIQ